jgi:hypothetical protein
MCKPGDEVEVASDDIVLDASWLYVDNTPWSEDDRQLRVNATVTTLPKKV